MINNVLVLIGWLKPPLLCTTDCVIRAACIFAKPSPKPNARGALLAAPTAAS